MADTFISYRRQDTSGYAGRLRDELEERLGRGRVFRDVDTLRPGQDFLAEIHARLAQCRTVLVLIGRDWAQARDARGQRRIEQDNDYVRLEIETALARRDLLIVPVLVEGASMPATADLPPSIASLARRQAISLRDDTWEADVDRLASLIGTGRRLPPSVRRPAVLTAAAAIALVAAAWWLWPERPSPAVDADPAAGAVPVAGGSGPVVAGTPGPVTPAFALRLPSRQEVAHGQLLFSLVSGSVSPKGAAKDLRLRFRISNEGPYAAHVHDGSFRLVAGERMLPATGGVNKAIPGRFIDEAIVSFDVPPGVDRAVLRILQGDAAGEMALDLQPTGRAPESEHADPGDALTRAIRYPVVTDPTPLLAHEGITLTVRSLSGRRFANVERLRLSLGVEHAGRYDWATGSATIRVLAGDETIAPFDPPSEVVQPDTRASFDYLFDLPIGTNRITLRVALGEARVEKTFALP